ncbi:Peptidase A2 domain-containing protein [Mycena chlorophos]|uniref:Peptidase A2 domain-containing protein n=1 Tax=Mycena chlorophos TaxID=658473 RepID=A0A8H6VQ05_MYCCL|nr:Peptidase A2 domain-containing protein [Mycena chlorophos]
MSTQKGGNKTTPTRGARRLEAVLLALSEEDPVPAPPPTPKKPQCPVYPSLSSWSGRRGPSSPSFQPAASVTGVRSERPLTGTAVPPATPAPCPCNGRRLPSACNAERLGRSWRRRGAAVSRATSEEAVESELLSSSDGSSEGSLPASSASTASDSTLRNSSSSPSRPPSRTDAGDNASITAALRARRVHNDLTPLFPPSITPCGFTCTATSLSSRRSKGSTFRTTPEDYNTMRDYGLDEVTGCLPGMSAERTQQFHDILVVATDSASLPFETIRNEDDEIVWRIGSAKLELVAHVVVATQQTLENLAFFGSRDPTSTFNLDLQFKMLRSSTAVGQLGPFRFNGEAKDWWIHLTEAERQLFSFHWGQLFGALQNHFITPHWRSRQVILFDAMRFRQPGHEKETPIQFFQRRISKNSFLNPVNAFNPADLALAVARVVYSQPAEWNSTINQTTCPTIAQLLDKAKNEAAALMAVWELHEDIRKRSHNGSGSGHHRFFKRANLGEVSEDANHLHDCEHGSCVHEQAAVALAADGRRNAKASNKPDYPAGRTIDGYSYSRDDSRVSARPSARFLLYLH